MSFFELNDLTTGYADKHGAKAISSHLNAQLQQGKLTCMLGPNGAGKSTLLRTMAAFQSALEGQIIVDDKPLATYTMQQLAQKISIVLTDSPKNMNMTVEEVVSLGRSPYTGFWGKMHEADWKAVNDSLKLIGIEDFRYRRLSSLSDGERQKVMIAKSITQGTPLIFLDEPTAFLDYPSKVRTMLLLHRLTRELGKTVFLSTHDMEHALWIADEIWLLDRNKGLTTGTPQQLSKSGQIGNYFDCRDMTYIPDSRRFAVTLPE
ncbi:MAG: ABC transporter ATP-binding protein [Bacteroidaceae bacterium]|nr:ABC transporter ATP-binding protein [Bacteroidaceae bacterium]